MKTMILNLFNRKKKTPHKLINPQSSVGKAYCYFNFLNNYINAHKNKSNICPKNCFECCYDYFYIGTREFYAIIHYLNNEFGNEYILEKMNLAQKYYEQFKHEFPDEFKKTNTIYCGKIDKTTINEIINLHCSDKDIHRLSTPCIFLNSKGKCDVYPVRPDACRLYGSVYNSLYQNIGLCSKVSLDNLTDISEIDYTQQLYHDLWSTGNLNRGYSIMDWFATILPVYYTCPEILNQCSILSETEFNAFRKKCLSQINRST